MRREAVAGGHFSAARAEQLGAETASLCATWPTEVVACFTAGTPVADCFKLLRGEQLKALASAVARTSRTDEPTCKEVAQVVVSGLSYHRPAWPGEEHVEDVLHGAVARHCETWAPATRTCAVTARDASSCLVEAGVMPTLDAELAPILALYKTAAARLDDTSIACSAVVEAHYGDAQWKGKLADRSAVARKRLIARSRDELAGQCTSWSPFMRACIVSATGEAERGYCVDTELAWAYPYYDAAGLGEDESTGIAACDDLLAAFDEYGSCDRLDDARQGEVLVQKRRLRQSWSIGGTKAERAKAAKICAAARAKIAANAEGCPISPPSRSR